MRIRVVCAVFVGLLLLTPIAPQNVDAGWTSDGTGYTYTLLELASITNGAVVMLGDHDFILADDVTISANDGLEIWSLDTLSFEPDTKLVIKGDLYINGDDDPVFFIIDSDVDYHLEWEHTGLNMFDIEGILEFDPEFRMKFTDQTPDVLEYFLPGYTEDDVPIELPGLVTTIVNGGQLYYLDPYESFMDFDSDTAFLSDTDADAMPDWWEKQNGLDPTFNDRQGDEDQDGLVNINEFNARTCPMASDTDGDGLSDNYEVTRNPPTSPTKQDTDGDTYNDKVEEDAGTDPTDPDPPWPS